VAEKKGSGAIVVEVNVLSTKTSEENFEGTRRGRNVMVRRARAGVVRVQKILRLEVIVEE